VIYTVTLNPSIDRTLTVTGFQVGGTFKASHSEWMPAGKGINVARVAATLGAEVTALGLVGENDLAAFGAALGAAGIVDWLVPVPGVVRACVTILDPEQHTETHVREPGNSPPESAVAEIESRLRRVRIGDWVVLAGSLPPGLAPDTYCRLVRMVQERGADALLDTNGEPLLEGIRGTLSVLKLNAFELWQVVHSCTDTAAEREPNASELQILEAAREVQDRGVREVIVSLGERGVLALDSQGRAWRARVELDRPVVDAVGSGDALAGGWVVARARGATFAEALRLGVACGAANVLTRGAGHCRRRDVQRLSARARVSCTG